jgi:hypothetical protein
LQLSFSKFLVKWPNLSKNESGRERVRVDIFALYFFVVLKGNFLLNIFRDKFGLQAKVFTK